MQRVRLITSSLLDCPSDPILITVVFFFVFAYCFFVFAHCFWPHWWRLFDPIILQSWFMSWINGSHFVVLKMAAATWKVLENVNETTRNALWSFIAFEFICIAYSYEVPWYGRTKVGYSHCRTMILTGIFLIFSPNVNKRFVYIWNFYICKIWLANWISDTVLVWFARK